VGCSNGGGACGGASNGGSAGSGAATVEAEPEHLWSAGGFVFLTRDKPATNALLQVLPCQTHDTIIPL
jgi:hypothetical protein